ncbi:single-stranded-DNA-specific exonuclease RecJ [Breoghania sp.]|uniref:single-stranded-DNA-specific exonuclease RecJ n=1 Tax=Breoghania sp. TaxID=2065378 RepID=UPI0026142BC6|nr:single-stranded-DNA-specific exonuclease RecJ [Breoghania sp.]MDJ0929577.1 single-stranded-DNA-specific exonuclease RecJ [Breoghania sp.]
MLPKLATLSHDGFREDPETRAFLGVKNSATGRAWRERLDNVSAMQAQAIAQRNGIPDIVSRVLAGRGVVAEEAAEFLEPSIRSLMPDPSSLVDMDAAAACIADAVERGEGVAVFGDYDVDGATSSALMTRGLRSLGLDPRIYIPDRIIEGYGPNPAAMHDLKAGGASLIITLDCGSVSFEALEEARKIGLDVVVADHHQVGVELPLCTALVNPNRQDNLSGQGHLAAVGVTFLVLVALMRELKKRRYFNGNAPDLLSWLDLVALGTVCDVVPLKQLNRAYVTKGLVAMHRRQNAGLAALADVARINGPLAPYHLGFLLGPRINAGGRIGDAALGARLLSTDDASAAGEIAAHLDRLNAERQAMEAAMLEEGEAQATAVMLDGEGPSVLVTGADNWHPGVVGLIASRLKARHRRPTFAISFDADGKGTSSGRSVPGVDLGGAVRAALDAGIILKGGGHAMAAGLTVMRDRVDDLKVFMEERLAADVTASREDHVLKIDGAVTASGATLDLMALLEKAGPYGTGHSEPVFALPSHRVTFADTVGNGHVRLSLEGSDRSSIKAIAFRCADQPLGQALLGARGHMLHVAGCLSLDHWQGAPKVQMRVLDAAEPKLGQR